MTEPGRPILRPDTLDGNTGSRLSDVRLVSHLGLGSVARVLPSVVYRMLRQMEADGWVSSTWDKDGSQGPPRRVYILSQSGEEVLVSWIEELKKVNEKITRLLKRSELDLRKGGKSDA